MDIPEGKPGYRVFIVEDNELYAKVLKKKLENKRYEVSAFYTGRECLNNLDMKPSIVTLDYRLPDISGEEMLAAVLKADPAIHVIVISGQDEIDTAVGLLKAGAYDYISKGPDTLEKLTHTIRNIHSADLLRRENDVLKSAIKEKYNFRKLIKGNSREIEQVFDLMERAVRTNISVSVSGETGTGKELVAKGIHYNSKRKDQPFVAVNVSAIPEGLIESELFGHEKGAFTGADFRKAGRFEQANGGTLFLDEIADLDLNLQAKLLRVIQERELTRLGSNQVIPLDVRIITATHKNLQKLVSEKKFRQDLYYRLLGLPIVLPPLRERGRDILLLARYFVDEFCRDNEMEPKTLSAGAKNALMNYAFPGNIRELKAVIELGCILSNGLVIETDHLNMVEKEIVFNLTESEKTLKQYNHDIVNHYLAKYNNNVKMVARKLGIGKSTIYRILQDRRTVMAFP
ncbi:MAG: sigma-54 dependent transcriptional regulator [Prolixibacteraceae bacterium]|jgi:DNA-binding NtrC family response regulator|nr:sigma-54-dependent Fis family transcriptional regulator [Prolixibacteraceae bacterium]MDI9563802.1 sigma-54 dependent transcriptional regulator [Bacteroidota bacterium]NLS99979.1 sigma-54-dependent Fis family transcriptional regulator [Bacteroidales bacterium]OQB81629.1 MAG: Transcriptional regulatory protein ZraR [Bacteroidetes bacterium ADurb.Bin123]HNZ68758.1 sigma-54 dependent transcriptional regulator [Prolixibacteraceae bacterium]